VALGGITLGCPKGHFPMNKERRRHIIELVIAHIVADPATRFLVRVARGDELVIWLVRAGVLYEYDTNPMRT
jgi:hypothetical protein